MMNDRPPYPSEVKAGMSPAILSGNCIGEGLFVVFFADAANISIFSVFRFLILSALDPRSSDRRNPICERNNIDFSSH